MKRRKMWVGLGTAVLMTSHTAGEAQPLRPEPAVGAVHGHATAVHRAGPHPGTTVAAAQTGGEGGEGGEGGGAALEPRLRVYRDLELIRGHLLVGDELVRQGRWAEALPHFLHPSEEIYGNIRDDLKTYDIPSFLAALKQLAQTVKAKNEGAYRTALTALDGRLDAAETSVRAKADSRTGFTVDAILEILNSATGEYEEAIENGRIANPVEYQDSRGFVWQAKRLFQGIAPAIAEQDAEAAKTAAAAFAELEQAWPTAVPPEKPARDLGQVLSDVSRIELALGRFK